MTTHTIIKDDLSVTIDAGAAIIDEMDLAANVHAIQWYGSTGEVEYNDGTPSLTLSNMDDYAVIIAAAQAVIDAQAVTVAAEEAAWVTEQATYSWKRQYGSLEGTGTKYGSIGEQLDQQYHDAVNGTTTWKDAIAAVKAAHPKP